MKATPILPEDDPDFFPSMPTQRGGASRPGEPPRGASAPDSLGSMEPLRGRTTPRGERLHAGDVLLGRYTVLSELGQGGMGVVYKCLDNVGGIEVALKCLPPELSRDETEMEGIRENYAIVARLHHAAISGLRHLERDPDFDEYYLVMDLAEGEDLSAMLRRRRGAPMPPAEALAILRPLASALDYAHGEKVLHRDVKPANVKVAFPGGASRPGEPRVQLLDFGLAAEVRSSMSRVSLRGHAGTSGTPAYMAPEQWEARPQSAATDQYALAVMAYQMLAGHLPFDADDTDLLRRAVLTRALDPVPGLPRAANAALQRALAKDPAARFPSCTAFVEALGRLAGTARPTTRWIAAAAAVAVAGLAAMWFGRARLPSAPSIGEETQAGGTETAGPVDVADSETQTPDQPPDSEYRNQAIAEGKANSPGEPSRGGKTLAEDLECAESSGSGGPAGEPINPMRDLALRVADGLFDDSGFTTAYEGWRKRRGSESLPLVEFHPFDDLTFRVDGVVAGTGRGRSDGRSTRVIVDSLSEAMVQKGLFRVANRFESGADADPFANTQEPGRLDTPDLVVSGCLSCETSNGKPFYHLRVSFTDAVTAQLIFVSDVFSKK